MDRGADRLGLAPGESRRRPLIEAHAFPSAPPAGRLSESGDDAGARERVRRLAAYAPWRRAQAAARVHHQSRGMGVAWFVEPPRPGTPADHQRGATGMPACDAATVRLEAQGHGAVQGRAQSAGQGHERVCAKWAVAALGMAEARVRVVAGDPDAPPWGAGSPGSRSAVSTGGARHRARHAVKATLWQVARVCLDTDAARDVAAGQGLGKPHPARRVALAQVAGVAYHRALERVLPQTVAPG